ncbi:hypothetical protein STIAU_2213 [Stigmatella aurantiaca DW4/3-1]|uniref:Uncharacterized protein n=1 Tax=Stigmatella aurantiaca (strain DW4/3-1) TaxID=378806 RepID=Q08TY6_STIAD|nr:hypothetical protein STIAU_2213 [Stigmatella aurantiaca DW4/3-1]
MDRRPQLRAVRAAVCRLEPRRAACRPQRAAGEAQRGNHRRRLCPVPLRRLAHSPHRHLVADGRERGGGHGRPGHEPHHQRRHRAQPRALGLLRRLPGPARPRARAHRPGRVLRAGRVRAHRTGGGVRSAPALSPPIGAGGACAEGIQRPGSFRPDGEPVPHARHARGAGPVAQPPGAAAPGRALRAGHSPEAPVRAGALRVPAGVLRGRVADGRPGRLRCHRHLLHLLAEHLRLRRTGLCRVPGRARGPGRGAARQEPGARDGGPGHGPAHRPLLPRVLRPRLVGGLPVRHGLRGRPGAPHAGGGQFPVAVLPGEVPRQPPAARQAAPPRLPAWHRRRRAGQHALRLGLEARGHVRAHAPDGGDDRPERRAVRHGLPAHPSPGVARAGAAPGAHPTGGDARVARPPLCLTRPPTSASPTPSRARGSCPAPTPRVPASGQAPRAPGCAGRPSPARSGLGRRWSPSSRPACCPHRCAGAPRTPRAARWPAPSPPPRRARASRCPRSTSAGRPASPWPHRR